MTSATILIPSHAGQLDGKPLLNCALEIDYERIDITSEFEPDLAWTYVDGRGHFHAYTADEKLPTLRGIPIEVPCDGACGFEGGCEGYTRTEYRCRLCDEVVEPKTRRPFGRRYMDGAERWTVKAVARIEDVAPTGFITVGGEPPKVSFSMTDAAGRVTTFGFGRLVLCDLLGDGFANIAIHGDGPLGRR